MDCLDAAREPEHAERQCEPSAYPSGRERGQREEGQRHETADEMVAGRRAGLRLEEVVVGHVERDQPDSGDVEAA